MAVMGQFRRLEQGLGLCGRQQVPFQFEKDGFPAYPTVEFLDFLEKGAGFRVFGLGGEVEVGEGGDAALGAFQFFEGGNQCRQLGGAKFADLAIVFFLESGPPLLRVFDVFPKVMVVSAGVEIGQFPEDVGGPKMIVVHSSHFQPLLYFQMDVADAEPLFPGHRHDRFRRPVFLKLVFFQLPVTT
jgi:hypothetical protein